MGKFVDGMKSLFVGADTSAQDAAAASARDGTRLAAAKQQEALAGQSDITERELGKVTRVPRGRRLLLAATGEAGLPDTLGG